jgi:hypothetical protein
MSYVVVPPVASGLVLRWPITICSGSFISLLVFNAVRDQLIEIPSFLSFACNFFL